MAKNIDQIKYRLAHEVIYTNTARKSIRYWLMGKGLITPEDDIVFRQHEWKNGTKTTVGQSFEDFLSWYDGDAGDKPYIFNNTKTYVRFIHVEHDRTPEIKVGDYVRTKYYGKERVLKVINIYADPEGNEICDLGNCQFIPKKDLLKFKVNGSRREEIIKLLNETYDEFD